MGLSAAHKVNLLALAAEHVLDVENDKNSRGNGRKNSHVMLLMNFPSRTSIFKQKLSRQSTLVAFLKQFPKRRV